MVKVRNIHTDQVTEVSEYVAANLSKDTYAVLGQSEATKTATKAAAPKVEHAK